MISLGTLSPELLIAVYAELGLSDQLRLSSTCRRLRDVGLRECKLYQSLSFTWKKARVSDSALLAATQHGHGVRELTIFIDASSCCDCAEDNLESYCDAEYTAGEQATDDLPALPASTTTLLRGRDESGGLLFPNLERLVLEFPRVYGDGDIFDAHRSIYWDAYDLDHPVQCNGAHVAAVMNALVKQRDMVPATWNVKSLRMVNVPPETPAAYHTDEWRHILAGVEHFEFSLYGDGENFDVINRQTSYANFMDGLDDFFLNWLPLVRTLKIHATEWGPLGADGYGPRNLPWDPARMPRLEELELSGVLVSSRLVSFLAAAGRATGGRPLSATLLEANAYARRQWLEDTDPRQGITWAAFFDRLRESGVVFSRFRVKPRRTELESYKARRGRESPRELTEEAVAARAKRAANPDQCIFSYGTIDNKYCDWVRAQDEDVRRFLQGEDEEAYERFMKRLRKVVTVKP